MGKGRTPVPTALKILRGNPGRRPLPPEEPTPPDATEAREAKVAAPDGLDARTRKVWDKYAWQIEAMGLLHDVDVPAFAMLCALIAESEVMPERMPATRIARMESLFARFGMDPASRARLGYAAMGRAKAGKGNAFGSLAG